MQLIYKNGKQESHGGFTFAVIRHATKLQVPQNVEYMLSVILMEDVGKAMFSMMSAAWLCDQQDSFSFFVHMIILIGNVKMFRLFDWSI